MRARRHKQCHRLLAVLLVTGGLSCLASGLALTGSPPPLAELTLDLVTSTASFGSVFPGSFVLGDAVRLEIASELGWRLLAGAVLPAGAALQWSADGGATWSPFSTGEAVILDGQDPAWPGPRTLTYSLRLTVDWSVPSGTYSIPIAYRVEFTDQDPPMVYGFSVNDGAEFTRFRGVTLTLDAADPSGVGSMRFSADGEAFAEWLDYALTSGYELAGGDGPKQVWVQVRDRAGNISPSVSAGITLDTVPPVISGVAVIDVTATGATVTWLTDEPASSRVEYGKTPSLGHWSDPLPGPVTEHSVPLDGLEPLTVYYYRVHAVDRAGNESLTGPFELRTTGLLAPVNLSHSIHGRQVKLAWDPPPAGDPGQYRVWRRDVEAGETSFTVIYTGSAHSCIDIIALPPPGQSTSYHLEYYVTAFQGDLESPPSDLVTVRKD